MKQLRLLSIVWIIVYLALLSGCSKKGETYEADFNGWHAVYAGFAKAQSFTCRQRGTIRDVSIRVARLNEQTPEGPLQVEVRDQSLEKIYATGSIAKSRAGRRFQWVNVDLEHTEELETGTYILLFHSRQTTQVSPWVVNAIYDDLYPYGRRIGGDDDIFFDVGFTDGQRVLIGPPGDAKLDLPINSGSGPMPNPGQGTLRLSFSEPHTPDANQDPVGPVPVGTRVRSNR